MPKSEDEWFAKNEKELIKNLQRERRRKEKILAEKSKEEESKRLRELHWMKCPKCGCEMKEEEVDSIKIDRCTACEGIYLDRGELEEFLLIRNEQKRTFLRKIAGIFS
jgi:acetyl-CoA carboxylase beta subunit